MQVQGEGGSQQRAFRNSFHAFRTILFNEGIRGIQKGLGPGMLYQISMNGSRLGSYGPFKRLLNANDPKTTSYYLPRIIGAGAMSGALGAFIGNPFFLIKVRMQTKASGNTAKLGTQHEYKSFIHAIKSIRRRDGGILKGLYNRHTLIAGMSRVTVGSAAQLASYDYIKYNLISRFEVIENTPILSRIVSAFGAGFFVVTAMNPFDVIATRIYNQKLGERYSGVLHCLFTTVRQEGISALMKGWTAHYFRLGPHTILTFMIWEQFKSIADSYGY